MTGYVIRSARALLALLLVGMLATAALTPLLMGTPPQSQAADGIKARIRELEAKNSEVRVRLADGKIVQGKIVRVEADTFTVRQKSAPQDVTLQFAQVTEVKKKGVSKAILIPAIAGGVTLLVLCAAPYPIGFLCRKDPS